MSSSTNRALAERVDAVEAKLDAALELLVRTWGATGEPVPRELRDGPRPALSVIRGGAE